MPYNPGVQNRVGDYLFQGISQAGQSIGQGIQAGRARSDAMEEKDKAEAADAKRLRKIMSMFKDDMGLSDSEIEGADVGTLRGMYEGHMLKTSQAGQELKRQRDMLGMQRDQLAMQLTKQGMESEGAFRSAVGQFDAPEPLRDVANPMRLFLPKTLGTESNGPGQDFDASKFMNMPPQPGMAAPRKMTPEIMRGIMAATGVLTPKMAMDMTESGDDAGGQWVEDKETGQRFFIRKNMTLPSGVNPSRMAKEPEPLYDKNENVMGYRIPIGNGKYGFKAASPAADAGLAAKTRKVTLEAITEGEKTLRALDDDIKMWQSQAAKAQVDKTKKSPEPKELEDLQARRERLRQAMVEERPAESQGAPAEDELPTITTKAEYDKLKPGTLFIQNGKQRRKPIASAE